MAGDAVLCGATAAVQSILSPTELFGRVGGEEFAVLLPGRAAVEARPTAERLREAVAGTPFTLPLRVSIGLASWPEDAGDRDALQSDPRTRAAYLGL